MGTENKNKRYMEFLKLMMDGNALEEFIANDSREEKELVVEDETELPPSHSPTNR